MRNILAGGVVWALMAAQAIGDTGLRQLATADDTRGFEAIGRIDLDAGSFCTGTLIGEALVLTAAHCLFHPGSLEMRDLSRVEFRAGWRDGRALAYRGVRRAIVHPEYDADGSAEGAERVANDIALLELDRPIRGNGIEPFTTAAKPRKGDPVGVVSYAVNREERPSLETGCDVLARPARMIVISCTVDFGASGAPILSFAEGRPTIVSVVSAKAEAMGRPVSLGVDIDGAIDRLLELAEDPAPVASAPTGLLHRTGSASGTAKFLRP